MSKFVDKIAGALGFSSEYDEYDEYEDEDYVEEEVPKKTVNYETNRTRYEEDRKEYDNIRPYRQKNSKVVNLHANVQMEVVVTSPETFDEAKEISQHIKDNKPVVINLEFVEQPIAQRITRFSLWLLLRSQRKYSADCGQDFYDRPGQCGFRRGYRFS